MAEDKQRDEDPFAVTPENVHKTQMIDADTDMILRYFGCLLMRKAAGLLRLYPSPPNGCVSSSRADGLLCGHGVAVKACTNGVHGAVLLSSLLRSASASQARHCRTWFLRPVHAELPTIV